MTDNDEYYSGYRCNNCSKLIDGDKPGYTRLCFDCALLAQNKPRDKSWLSVTLIDLLKHDFPAPGQDFTLDVILYDIPSVLIGAINNLPDNCRMILLDTHTQKMRHGEDIVAAAHARGIQIQWMHSVIEKK